MHFDVFSKICTEQSVAQTILSAAMWEISLGDWVQ